MLGAMRIVDPVTQAEIVELVRAAGMLAARQHQGVDNALATESRLARARELEIDEGEIEIAVMRDKRRVTDEGEEFIRDRHE